MVGLRAGEVLGLNLDGISLEYKTATVMGKGSKQRVVPIGRTAMRHLESYLKAVQGFFVRADRSEPALFLNINGQRLAIHNLARIISKAASVLSVDFPVTPHTFRRSCTTEMVRGGANLYHIKELLGHESLDTLRHYTRLTILDLQKTHARCHPREREKQP